LPRQLQAAGLPRVEWLEGKGGSSQGIGIIIATLISAFAEPQEHKHIVFDASTFSS